MREIKFRGKAKMSIEELDDLYLEHENGWVYGHLVMYGKTPYIVGDFIEVDSEYTVNEFWVPVYPESVGQFTNLKDKNNKGKEIFEGDIVEFNNCNYLRTGGYLDDEILRGKVIFAYGGWMIKTNKGDYDLYPSIFNDEELEVIGNVFEDSHLLEEQHG
jgi:uncharacterized phage protein (TIGR01671 family)